MWFNFLYILSEILNEEDENLTSVMFSFSRNTTKEELNYTLQKKELM